MLLELYERKYSARRTGVTLLAEALLGLVRVQVLLGVECGLAQIFEVRRHDVCVWVQ